jgi:addiction module RelB/DinJ family antitoxin
MKLLERHAKKKRERVLRKLGLPPTETISMLCRQISLRAGLPFPGEIPNELTTSTLVKNRRGGAIQAFESAEAMFKTWEK